MKICSFNDRLRDAVVGGSPFGHPLQQGFVTGLLLQVINIFLSIILSCKSCLRAAKETKFWSFVSLPGFDIPRYTVVYYLAEWLLPCWRIDLMDLMFILYLSMMLATTTSFYSTTWGRLHKSYFSIVSY